MNIKNKKKNKKKKKGNSDIYIILLLTKNVHKLLLRRSNPVLDRYGSIPLGETSHRYPSPPLMGPALQCRVADLAARMAYTTLVSNPGDLDWHAE